MRARGPLLAVGAALTAGALWYLWRAYNDATATFDWSFTEQPPASLSKRMWRTGTGIPNTPPADTWANLQRLQDALRQLENMGVPLTLTSAYRSALVNVTVGGVNNSKHRAGLALDVKPAGGRSLDELEQVANLLSVFTFVYREKTWLHLEIAP